MLGPRHAKTKNGYEAVQKAMLWHTRLEHLVVIISKDTYNL